RDWSVTGVQTCALPISACGRDATPQQPADAYVNLDAPDHAGAGPGGGLLPELRFAVVGDTRPANLDDTANYPTDIVRAIWTDVRSEERRVGKESRCGGS